MRSLMQDVHWEGCGGLELTEEMRLVIAAQACLLTLGFEGDPYPRVKEILVYPRGFFPSHVRDFGTWVKEQDTRPASGQALSTGSVVVAWDHARDGAADSRDGDNVVFHEFAHQLAFQSQLIPDRPTRDMGASGIKYLIPNVPDPARWNKTLKDSMDRLCDQLNAGVPSVLNTYGATNMDEFFAVATETFFERPKELLSAYPDLYVQLQSFYRQDPAARV
jgi:Mlc titration factor MtfA (ptsG expression regulator)